ncbi:MAG: hypothetical protein KGI80_05075 [Verrucomicrobiota bacterium]|nr:hypothetical protein [Verrucomicrobiota bacterium]
MIARTGEALFCGNQSTFIARSATLTAIALTTVSVATSILFGDFFQAIGYAFLGTVSLGLWIWGSVRVTKVSEAVNKLGQEQTEWQAANKKLSTEILQTREALQKVTESEKALRENIALSSKTDTQLQEEMTQMKALNTELNTKIEELQAINNAHDKRLLEEEKIERTIHTFFNHDQTLKTLDDKFVYLENLLTTIRREKLALNQYRSRLLAATGKLEFIAGIS